MFNNKQKAKKMFVNLKLQMIQRMTYKQLIK